MDAECPPARATTRAAKPPGPARRKSRPRGKRKAKADPEAPAAAAAAAEAPLAPTEGHPASGKRRRRSSSAAVGSQASSTKPPSRRAASAGASPVGGSATPTGSLRRLHRAATSPPDAAASAAAASTSSSAAKPGSVSRKKSLRALKAPATPSPKPAKASGSTGRGRRKRSFTAAVAADAGEESNQPAAPVARTRSRSLTSGAAAAAATACAATATASPAPSPRRQRSGKGKGKGKAKATATPADAQSVKKTSRSKKRARLSTKSVAPIPALHPTMSESDGDADEAGLHAELFDLAFGGGEEDDGEDDGGMFGAGSAAASLAAAMGRRDPSSALQGLLSRLGGPGLAMMGGFGGSKYQRLLEGLQAVGDESRQMAALNEVTQLLLMGNEETLGGFRASQFVGPLQDLLNVEYNPNMALMSCRALTNMLEAIPNSSRAVAVCVPSLCAKLLCIEYIDLAEQSLICLGKLSADQGRAILEAGGLNAVLSYLDFFPSTVQRSAVATAANICKHVRPASLGLIRDSIPILSNLLDYKDTHIMESACQCFSRLVDSLSSDTKCLMALTEHALLEKLVGLITSHAISKKIFAVVLRLLSLLCRCCPELCVQLHDKAIGTSIRSILNTDADPIAKPKQAALSGSTYQHTEEELLEIIRLSCELLPPLPSSLFYTKFASSAAPTGAVEWEWMLDDGNTWRRYSKRDSATIEGAYSAGRDAAVIDVHGRQYTVDLVSMTQSNSSTMRGRSVRRCAPPKAAEPKTKNTKSDPRTQFFKAHVDALRVYCEAMMPAMFDVFLSSAAPLIKYKCVEAMVKMVYSCPKDLLLDLLRDLTISSYLSGMLCSADNQIVLGALQMADLLMGKLPDIFHQHFRRRGVAHEIRQLAAQFSVGKGEEGAKASPSLKKSRSKLSLSLRRRGSTSKDEKEKRPKGKKKGRSRSEDLHASAAAAADGDGSGGAAAAAAATGRRASLGARGDGQTDIRLCIGKEAKRLSSTHFSVDGNSLKPADDPHPSMAILRRLLQLSSDLDGSWTSGSEKAVLTALRQIQGVVCDVETPASSFETYQSGLIASLLRLLTEARSSKSQLSLDARLRIFQSFSFTDSGLPFVEAIVGNLHWLLNTLEQFPLKKAVSATASTLSTPIKLKLVKDATDRRLREYKAQVVMIDPHACVLDIKDYLWPRVKKSRAELAKAAGQHRQKSKLRSRSSTGSEELDGDDYIDFDDGEEAEEAAQSEKNGDGGRQSRAIELHLPPADQGSAEVGFGEPLLELPQASGNRSQLQVFMEGHALPDHMTIYQAISKFGGGSPVPEAALPANISMDLARRLLGHAQTLTFRAHAGSTSSSGAAPEVGPAADAASRPEKAPGSASALSPLEKSVRLSAKATLAPSDPTYPMISLLNALHGLNGLVATSTSATASISASAFVNNRLTSKLMRQVADYDTICKASFPEWCSAVISTSPFLLPFEARQAYFFYTRMHSARALQRFKEDTMQDGEEEGVKFRLARTKVRISRDRVLQSAYHVLHAYAAKKSLLEIEYYEEAGTGLGPTLEFFTLVSQALQEKSLGIWRDGSAPGAGDDVKHVFAPNGLYPAPAVQDALGPHQLQIFRLLGLFLAKALVDGRMVDLPLSPVLLEQLLDAAAIGLDQLAALDRGLHQTLLKLQSVCEAKQALLADKKLSDPEKQAALAALTLDGARIKDLCLDFTVPGYPAVPLKAKGADTEVTIHNLDEYVELVVKAVLGTAVAKQMEALRDGFNEVFELPRLDVFTPDEMTQLFSGASFRPWTVEELADACTTDHGFTSESPTVAFLFQVLAAFDEKEQRAFVLFVTGAPNLPVGGLSSLRPPLTIVRKSTTPGAAADAELPSVMTCQNYLKLPEYSGPAVLEAKLRKAMTEGQGSFHLS